MAIDYGDVRIGVALTDPLQIIARSYATLSNSDEVYAELIKIIREECVEQIVLGMPYSEQATIGFAAKKVVKFAKRLTEQLSLNGLDIPLYEHDEGYTTVNAYQAMSRMKVKKRSKKKQIVDQIAATRILQEFMNSKKKMTFKLQDYLQLIGE